MGRKRAAQPQVKFTARFLYFEGDASDLKKLTEWIAGKGGSSEPPSETPKLPVRAAGPKEAWFDGVWRKKR